MRIAVIGLGAMGAACARNLLNKGFDVVGYDLRRAALEEIVAAGGRQAGSAGQAASGADVVITFVVNSSQVESVVFGDDGVASTLADGAVLVQCATVSAAYVAQLGRRLAERGRLLVDAPVSGGVPRAGNGTLSVMASGPRDAMARAKPVLDAIGEHVYDFGDAHGAGSTVKTINQLLCGVHLAVLGEAIALGRKAGLDPAQLLEVFTRSAASSWMMNDRGPRALEEDPPTRSAVDIFVKDLGLVMDAGRELKFPLPMAATALQQFLALSAQGKGGIDDSHLWRAYPL